MNLPFGPGYSGAAQPRLQFCPVATRSIAATNSPAAREVFSHAENQVVDTTPQNDKNKVSYDSSLLFLQARNSESVCWAGMCVWEALLCIFNGSNNREVKPEADKLFSSMCRASGWF